MSCMRDKRYKELQASHDACQQKLTQLEKQHAQLEDKCMRLEAELTSCQKLLADSEKRRAKIEQKRSRAPKYSLCSFFSSSEFGTDQDSSEKDLCA